MNEKHLSIAELTALTERGAELTPEMAEHLDRCAECADLLERHLAAEPLLTLAAADDAAIDRIAARSFGYLADEKPGFFAALFTLPRIALGAAAALVIVAAYFGFATSTTTDESKFVDNDPAPKTAPALDATPRAFADGVAIAHGRAALTVKGTATLAADGAETLRLAKGTVEVSIEKGNDFIIHTADRYMVRVLGTRFTLDTDGVKLTVTVTEGLVEVIDGRSNDSVALSGGMSRTFADEPKAVVAIPKEHRAIKATVPEPVAVEPASFLKMGRGALKANDATTAMGWFEKELAEGAEKDKALFEIVRLHEKEGRFGDILAVLKAHGEIVDGGSVFREELLIKGCKAEVKQSIGTLPSCRKYLQVFPAGYKKDEIRDLLENGDAR
ncbi:MAG TPA: FecR domain-containing protein [bacterium]|nr:FecR domain-containing protein [bacterium]